MVQNGIIKNTNNFIVSLYDVIKQDLVPQMVRGFVIYGRLSKQLFCLIYSQIDKIRLGLYGSLSGVKSWQWRQPLSKQMHNYLITLLIVMHGSFSYIARLS